MEPPVTPELEPFVSVDKHGDLRFVDPLEREFRRASRIVARGACGYSKGARLS